MYMRPYLAYSRLRNTSSPSSIVIFQRRRYASTSTIPISKKPITSILIANRGEIALLVISIYWNQTFDLRVLDALGKRLLNMA